MPMRTRVASREYEPAMNRREYRAGSLPPAIASKTKGNNAKIAILTNIQRNLAAVQFRYEKGVRRSTRLGEFAGVGESGGSSPSASLGFPLLSRKNVYGSIPERTT